MTLCQGGFRETGANRELRLDIKAQAVLTNRTEFAFYPCNQPVILMIMMIPEVKVVDTVTKLTMAHRDTVLVGASHCGVYAVYLAAAANVRALILTDAGVGLDEAGVGGLAWADDISLPVAAADFQTCRIADGRDVMANGIIGHVNQSASELGCQVGMSASDCAEKMRSAKAADRDVPDYGESRFVIEQGDAGLDVIGCDSISLLLPEDAGRFAVTASHGALLGGLPDDGAVGMALAGVTFSDAGVGKEEAGIARLAVLDERGIPAATVDAMTARIGDARSNWETGVLSHINGMAEALDVSVGMTVQDFAAIIRGSALP